jgi:iron complex outermembrane receptor protein
MGVGQLYCLQHPGDPDFTTHQCTDVLGAPGTPRGSTAYQQGELEYVNQAIYAQGTWEFNDMWSVDLGIRQTWDETTSRAAAILRNGYPLVGTGPATNQFCTVTTAVLADGCWVYNRQESDAPTWLVGVNFTPTEDLLLYASYKRGYRQGGINLLGAQGFQTHQPEQVDAYEIGMKATFDGPVPGYFNIAAFYNDLTDQQIQIGFASNIVTNTTGIVNAGASIIEGVEIESSLRPLENLRFDISYTYHNTKVEELTVPALLPYCGPPVNAPPPCSVYSLAVPSTATGRDLPLSPAHKYSVTATYDLPVPESWGELAVSSTYVYTDEQLVAVTSPFGVLPSYEIVNFNLNWSNIGGGPVDASLFVTNAFDEEYLVYVPGLYSSLGAEFRNLGVPRMAGIRLRYNFGE